MCSCHSILECCVTFSGVKLSIKLFVLLQKKVNFIVGNQIKHKYRGDPLS